jgi:YfiH family protein
VSVAWIEPDWPAPAAVRALSTFRGGGVSASPYASLNLGEHVGDAPAAVAENRRRLAVAAALPAEPVWLTQVHGAAVANLDQDDPALTVDAAFTRRKERVCAILTADCLPILLTADSGTVVGAVHAGWRGLAAGVIEAGVAAFGVPAPSVLAWLGPCIGPRHYEIGAEVAPALLSADGGAGAGLEKNSRGRFMADLARLARRRLERLGITRIYGGTQCTFSEAQRYFSHRRDGQTGRQATFIWLRDAKHG